MLLLLCLFSAGLRDLGSGRLPAHLVEPLPQLQDSTSAASLPLPLQNRQTFNSLTCLSSTAEDGCQRLPGAGEQPWPAAPEVMPGRTPACTPVPEPARARPQERRASRDDLSCEEEEESTGKEEDRAAWRSVPGTESLFQLDGEIDIEQIENN